MADLIDRDALEPFYESGTDPNDTYADMTFIRAEHIENAPAVNRWIFVDDALPEDGQRVLICSKSNRLFDVVFRANAQMPSFDTKIFGKVYAWYCEDVIKWMPLPEPPEKE